MSQTRHGIYYLLEFLMLLFGFVVIYLLPSFLLKTILLLVLLVFYIALGIIHHKMHHSFHKKIVIEYILVSAVILAAFVFVNIGRFSL